MPDSGTISPTLTSAGACARATPTRPTAAAPDSTVRGVRAVLVLPFYVLFILFAPWSLFLCWSHAEIRFAHAVVGAQRVVVSLEHDVSGFEDIAVVGGFERFGDALLDQQHGQAGRSADIDQAFEDEVGRRRREPHRR